MLKRLLTTLFVVVAVAGFAQVASAQYMFMDSNANGIHDAGDQLNANGTPTTVDIYLDTNHTRDGSTAVCGTGPEPLDMISYVFNLNAANGTVTYAGFINQIPTFTVQLGTPLNPDGIRYKNAIGGAAVVPPGKYRLSTMTITGVTGTPRIDVVDLVMGSADFTSFGTNCLGNDFDNTYKLAGPAGGSDWTDADGLAQASGPVNNPPDLAPIGNRTVAELATLAFTATATDPDAGQTRSFTLDAGSPAGATINASTGAFTWTPTEAQGPGTFPITVRVTDNGTPVRDDFEAISVTVNEVNVAPVVTNPGNRTVAELTNLAFTATATDADLPANTLTFSLDAGAPAGATIGAGTGAFSWTPTEAQGPGTFPVTIRATDNGTPSLFGTTAITISVTEVNLAPVLGAIGNRTVQVSTLLAFTATATDPDVPANTLTFSLEAGAPAGATINGSTGAFAWTPAATGTFPITVRVTDNGTPPLFDNEAITVSVVAAPNQAPVLGAIGNRTVAELATLAFTATATDPNAGDVLTFSLEAGAPAGATINGTTGAFSWTPTEAQGPGSFPITVRVTDNGAGNLFDNELITVTVTEVNVAPVVTSPGNRTVAELTNLAFTVTATDADLPANTISWSLDAGAPAGATIGAGTGAFSWTPTEAQGPGSFPVTIRATDNGTPALSGTAAITIAVTEVNVAPVVTNPGNRTVAELANLAFTVTATDADLPANTIAWSLDAGAPAGATIGAGTGAFSWTPTEAQGPGTFPITIRATDNGTPALSGTAAITVTVTEVNVAPVVTSPGNRTVAELTALAFTVTATDADLPANTITWSLDAGAPAGATINGGGAFSWTPTEAQGPGSFPVTIRATDNGTPALSGTAAITISVTEVNVAPVLGAIGNRTVQVSTLLAFTATATDADVPANTLTFSLEAGAPAGATINGSTGAFAWTPAATGSFGVTVRVTDNGTPALFDNEAITVSVVAAPNQAPVLGAIGNRTVAELATLAFTATATDPNAGQVLTFSLEAGAPAGATINGTTGAFSWTPTEAQGPGSFPITVRVTDNGAGNLFDNELITVTVTEVNVAPVVTSPGNRTVAELTALAFTVTATDADLPANTIAWSLDAGAPAGATINGGGAFSWTPTEAQGPGSFPVTIRATDNGTPALSGTAAITISVTEVNVAPVLGAIGNRTVQVSTLLAFTATATDADVPANTLTFSLEAGAPAGATINGSTGAFAWTPAATGSFPITVRVTDNGTPALFDNEAITVTVNAAPNQAPVLGAIGNRTVAELATLAFTATATDPNAGDVLTFTLDSGAPAGATINGTTGAFSWTPLELQGPGSFPITVRVTDSGTPSMNDFEAITVTVTEVNQAPVLGAIGNRTVAELATLAFTATATDADIPSNTVNFSLDAGAPAGATINAGTGAFSWTPTEAQGPGSFPVTIRATDNGTPALSDFETITVTVTEVNVAPVVTSPGNRTVAELTNLAFTVTATDADLPANTITWTLDAGAPAGAAIGAATGAFSWTPTEAQGPGSFPVTIRATDNGTPALSGTAAITISVTEVNVAPVLAPIGNKSGTTGSPVTFTATATDADLPANTLTFSLEAGAPAGSTINGSTGAFSWTPSATGSFPVTVRVTDNGTPALFDNEAITITISPTPNSPPVLGAIGNRTVAELATLAFTATATDPDAGQTRTFSLDAGNPVGSTINGTTGAFSWTPTEAQGPGSFPITVRVTDNGTGPLSDTETITVTVTEVNVAPVVTNPGNRTVAELANLAFTVTATDADVPANTISWSLDAGAPAGATINGGGAFSWTPTEAQGPGTFPITIRATDNGTPALSGTAAITVTVTEVNVAPVLGAIGNRTVNELATLAFTATASDADLPANTLTFSLEAGAPAGATINGSTGAFSWTPTEAQGPGSFPITVRVTDNGTPALFDNEAITVTVNEVNVAPVVTSPGNRTVAELTNLAFTVTATDADLPANTITWSLDAGAPAGATINGGGAFSWTPTEAQGPGSFPVTIRATDNGTPVLSGTAAITITVTEVNVAPVLAAIGSRTVQVSTLLAFTATATDADVPANTLTFSLEAGAPAGATINGSTGAFAWTPGATGSFPITVRVTDNGTPALFDNEAITVTVVAAPNQAPVLGAIGNRTVAELATLAFTATATDPNAGQVLTFSLEAGAPAGATINGTTGAFSWTPTEAQGPGSFPITVRVTDNGAGNLFDNELITVTVTEVNVAPVVTSPGNRTVAELTALAFTVTATDADLPANTISWSLDAGAPAGATINGGGAFSWTPTEAQGPGSFPVTIRATDNGTPALSGTAAITISVTEVNVAPVLGAIGNRTVQVSTLLAFTATATDADVPANTLTFSLEAGAPAGATINGSTGAFAWTPAATGSFGVTVRVTDNGTPALFDNEAITVTVTAQPNSPPVLGAIGNRTVAELATLAFTATATDPDAGQTRTFSLDAGNPAGSTINGTTGAFSWTPTEAQGPGSFPITVRVTDNGAGNLSDFEAITVTVTEVNVAPVVTSPGNRTVAELTALAFTVTATDADLPANTISWSLDAGAPAGATINGGGAFSWTPTEAQGPGSFPVTIRATDNGTPALSGTAAITITVNEVNVAPVLGAIGNRTVAELATLAITATATDADLPANVLTFSLDSGNPIGSAINATTGVITWTPTEAQGPGSYPLTVRVTDNGTPALSDFETITVTVTEVNVAPVVTNPGNRTVAELTNLAFTVTATDADVPANTISWSLDAGAPAGATINGGGAFSWTPTEAQGPGSYPVTIRATDNGTPALSGTAAITISVTEVNVAPVLATIGNKSGTVGVAVTFTATATDADVPANTLTFSLEAGAPAGATINGSTGAFAWTPSATGSFPVTVRVTDNGTPALFDNEAITITVGAAPNQAPVLGAIGNKTVAELSTLAFTATATDPDAGQTLTFSLDAPSPAGATINGSTGAFSWTPTEAQGPAAIPITVRVTDNGSPSLSDFETIAVAITEVNVAPVLAAIGNKTVAQFALLSFIATATDADIPANTLTFSLDAGAPAGATINGASGAFSWTPGSGGSFPITVRVTDNGTPALSDFETITVTVTGAPADQAPTVSAPLSAATSVGSAVSFTVTATDPDGHPINSLIASPLLTGATFTPNGSNTSGTFFWAPVAGQEGTHTITFTASNALSGSATTEVAIGPEAAATSGTVRWTAGQGDCGSTYTVIWTATDGEGNSSNASTGVTVVCSGPAPSLAGSIGRDSASRFAVNAAAAVGSPPVIIAPANVQTSAGEPLAITVFVTDPDGGPVSLTANTSQLSGATFTTDTAPQVSAPSAASGNEGALLTINVTASDPDSDPISSLTADLSVLPLGNNAVFTANGSNTAGTLTWTPSFSDAGVYNVEFTATNSLSGSATTVITIGGANRAPTADANGPYAGSPGNPVHFDGTGSTDPDGDVLTYDWNFGDSSTGNGAQVAHSYAATGVFTVTLRVTDPGLLYDEDTTTATISDFVAANVFYAYGLNIIIPQILGTWIRMEPIAGSFNLNDVLLNSLKLTYNGVTISSLCKNEIKSDTNKNGLSEIRACFRNQEVEPLFAALPNGTTTVTLTLEADLLTGGKARGTTTARVFKASWLGAGQMASVSPNPLNPQAKLSFMTLKPGVTTIQVFDINGRLVRNLMQRQYLMAGLHEVTIDGRNAQGNKLASGVYYYRVNSADGVTKGSFIVMK